MNLTTRIAALNRFAGTIAGPVQPVWLLAVRLHVSWQFLKSGWLKVLDWENTVFLFQEEYKVPLLSPGVAALAGTAGELLFPVLLILGVAGRYAAAGLFAVNALAVVSYAHVLFGEGFEAALGQHYLWGALLITVVMCGPGKYSMDGWIAKRSARMS